MDFAYNCLDQKATDACKICSEFPEKGKMIRFVEHDISEKIELRSDYGMCCDVMEHIPTDQVDAVLENILENSKHVFFQISTVDDAFGNHPDIDEPLHLTVRNYQWWLKKFVQHGVIIHHSNQFKSHVIFYVTGWGDVRFGWDLGKVNTDPETVIKQMTENAKLDLEQVKPHEAQEDMEVMFLAGGPSLNDYEEEIIAQREAGMPLITANGTYKWAIDRGLKPSLQLVIDGRKHNKRFLEPVIEDCKYAIASQCHPDLLKDLPKDKTYLWQVSLSDDLLPTVKELWGKMYEDWYPCPGGSTVILRGLCLLRMLGFHKIHLYGFDSCLLPNKAHHAYEQKENDANSVVEMIVGKGTEYEKRFECHPWMAYQAKEFQDMVPRLFQDLKLDIKGNGLISYLIKSGADLAAIQEQ